MLQQRDFKIIWLKENGNLFFSHGLDVYGESRAGGLFCLNTGLLYVVHLQVCPRQQQQEGKKRTSHPFYGCDREVAHVISSPIGHIGLVVTRSCKGSWEM